MDVFWQSLFGFLEKLVVSVVPVVAAYVGWRLGQKDYVRQLQVDNIKSRFDALREIKSVIGSIPPDLGREGLLARLSCDHEFRSHLTQRMVRLFGLRNELIPYIAPELVDLIDKRLEPLFTMENGAYTFKAERVEDLAEFAHEARLLIASTETKLTDEYSRQLR